jgi:hypothetical protein
MSISLSLDDNPKTDTSNNKFIIIFTIIALIIFVAAITTLVLFVRRKKLNALTHIVAKISSRSKSEECNEESTSVENRYQDFDASKVWSKQYRMFI